MKLVKKIFILKPVLEYSTALPQPSQLASKLIFLNFMHQNNSRKNVLSKAMCFVHIDKLDRPITI